MFADEYVLQLQSELKEVLSVFENRGSVEIVLPREVLMSTSE